MAIDAELRQLILSAMQQTIADAEKNSKPAEETTPTEVNFSEPNQSKGGNSSEVATPEEKEKVSAEPLSAGVGAEGVSQEPVKDVSEYDSFRAVVENALNNADFFAKYDSKRIIDEIQVTPQPFENLHSDPLNITTCGVSHKIQRYERKIDIPKLPICDKPKDQAKALRKMSVYLLQELNEMFGGLERITNFAIISDVIIVNSVSFEPILPMECVESLPFDIRDGVMSGKLAWLFDFDHLKRLKNLTSLCFDSADFVFKKVRTDLDMDINFEPSNLFSMFKHLNILQVGETIVRRSELDKYGDIFKKAKRTAEIVDKICSLDWSVSHKMWGKTKSFYMDKDRAMFWKLAATPVVIVGGAVTLGVDAISTVKAGTSLAGKVAKGIKSGVIDIKNVLSEKI